VLLFEVLDTNELQAAPFPDGDGCVDSRVADRMQLQWGRARVAMRLRCYVAGGRIPRMPRISVSGVWEGCGKYSLQGSSWSSGVCYVNTKLSFPGNFCCADSSSLETGDFGK